MPSFSSSAAEMRHFAKAWRRGNAAFNDLFNVSGVVRRRESSKSENSEAYDALNTQWVKDEATRKIAPVRKEVKKLASQGAGKAELRSLRSELRQRRKETAQTLTVEGIVGRLNNPESKKDTFNTKTRLKLGLGEYLLERDKWMEEIGK